MSFEKIGLEVPKILFPNKSVDLKKWAVVACDQYTSQPDYWKKVEEYVGSDPSTFNTIYPEVYLEEENPEVRIDKINDFMKNYIKDGVLSELPKGFVLLDRKTSQADSRKGLIVALNLEQYDYTPTSQTLIRATEGTIVDRIPPRVKIRKEAELEMPHIMVLIDDPEKSVIEPLFEKNLKPLYDFDLMMDSGHVKAFLVDNKEDIKAVAENLTKLADPKLFSEKYGVKDLGVLLFAMGDGNHSLATAKAIWEDLKKNSSDKAKIMEHPARYALVELVNVHDEGLQFEPIHRVLFNANADKLLLEMESYCKKMGCEYSLTTYNDADTAHKEVLKKSNEDSNNHYFAVFMGEQSGVIQIKSPKHNLEVGTLQAFLDLYLKEETEVKIDYVHGEDVVYSLSKEKNNIGFTLPPMKKSDLFKTVIVDGALPRKTFSMGEADEKRFYLECRKISL